MLCAGKSTIFFANRAAFAVRLMIFPLCGGIAALWRGGFAGIFIIVFFLHFQMANSG